jgi:hypothetical protein
MRQAERRSWYQQMYPHLLKYHEWLYRERDPHKEGLILLLHPYESGLRQRTPLDKRAQKTQYAVVGECSRAGTFGRVCKFSTPRYKAYLAWPAYEQYGSHGLLGGNPALTPQSL